MSSMREDMRDWLARNRWYEKDEVARDYADSVALHLRAEGVKMTGVPFLDMVAAKVAEIVPDRVNEKTS